MFRSRHHRATALIACLTALTFTGACSGTGPASSPAPAKRDGGSVAAETGTAVKANLAVPAAFTAPGPALTNVASVRGKKLLYIPISLQIPSFQSVLQAMQEATGKVGMTVEGCDGKFNPAGVATCVNQALANKVDGVVLDNVPLGMAGQGIAQLQKAGIPILVGQQEAQPGDAKLAYLATGGDELIADMADWVSVDAGGAAKVLVVQQSDSPQQIAYVTNGLMPRFAKSCPGCEVEVISVSSAQLSKLGTEVSTALLKKPDIKYIVSEFDANVGYILQGLKNSPNGDKVKIVSVIGDIASLQRVKNGQQAYDAIASYRWAGWALTDQVLRMLTGAAPLQRAVGPIRAFDASNIGSVTVAQASFDDESLWGGDTYSKIYLGLWGVA